MLFGEINTESAQCESVEYKQETRNITSGSRTECKREDAVQHQDQNAFRTSIEEKISTGKDVADTVEKKRLRQCGYLKMMPKLVELERYGKTKEKRKAKTNREGGQEVMTNKREGFN